MKKRIVTIIALGVALAGCGSNSSSTAAPNNTAPQSVATKTITKTVTKTVYRTPQSCKTALKEAEKLVHGPVTQSNHDTIKLLGMIERALYAGYNQDVQAVRGITSDIKTISGRYQVRTHQVQQIVSDYNTAASDCRSH